MTAQRAQIIDGKAIAAKVKDEVRAAVETLRAAGGGTGARSRHGWG